MNVGSHSFTFLSQWILVGLKLQPTLLLIRSSRVAMRRPVQSERLLHELLNNVLNEFAVLFSYLFQLYSFG